MNTLPLLIRREFWEHRNAFVIVPSIVTGFLVLMMLVIFTASTSDWVNLSIDIDEDHHDAFIVTDDVVGYLLTELDDMSERRRVRQVNQGLQAMGVPLTFILWFVVFFYLLACLYDDRRDRSILFWKSLPVSDAMTVVSKLVTALIVVPLVYLAGIAVLQLSALVFMTFGAWSADLSALELLWGPAELFSNWFQFIGVFLFYIFWALPFFAWLMVVSSFAKSVPLAWAIGIPFGITITERIFTSQSALADWMANHTIPVRFMGEHGASLSDIQAQAFSLDMLSAVVVGAALVGFAIWLRGRADEI